MLRFLTRVGSCGTLKWFVVKIYRAEEKRLKCSIVIYLGVVLTADHEFMTWFQSCIQIFNFQLVHKFYTEIQNAVVCL